jgi:quinoprotein glucose dehydrogenase
MRYQVHFLWAIALLLVGCEGKKPLPFEPSQYRQWRCYGGTPDAARFSSLTQIDTQNAANLRLLWEYHTGDLDSNNRGQIQCNPIVIDSVLYGTTSRNRLFALHASTGRQLWIFDPFAHFGGANSWAGTSRGVAYWSNGTNDHRILFAAGNSLIAINAHTGLPVSGFGQGGRIDLQRDLDHHRDSFLIVSNTPGVIYNDLIIMGMRVSEGLDAAPGHIRAYDVRTGQRRWIFHTIPHPGEFGHDTWSDPEAWQHIGGANCWAGMSVDTENGIVFAATGSATYDFWGGNRLGRNLFSNCIIALDANTGRRIWHYQTVHHDLWDRDLPANPNLVTVLHQGRPTAAVAQITKQGFVFVLDRLTGKPLFPIEERPVPASILNGESAWPTQPHPLLPEPFMRQSFTEADINNISPAHHAEISDRFRTLQTGQMFAPPSVQGLALFPGFDGGAEWGGASFDPATGWLYVNANEMPWVMKMTANNGKLSPGQAVYRSQCANCHGVNRQGNGTAFPKLTEVSKKYTPNTLNTLLISGRGAMPAFGHLSEKDRHALSDFLLGLERGEFGAATDIPQTPYIMAGYERFLTRDGYPAIEPPWGTLNAIDLNTGRRVWQQPLGELPELTALGIPPTGTENYGGPVSTAGGVLFIGASKDGKFRVFNKRTGQLLWQTQLPAGGYATPAVFEVGGKQLVVIACGGGKMGTPSGDSYVCFGL